MGVDQQALSRHSPRGQEPTLGPAAPNLPDAYINAVNGAPRLDQKNQSSENFTEGHYSIHPI